MKQFKKKSEDSSTLVVRLKICMAEMNPQEGTSLNFRAVGYN